jgi:hypothetical protein
MCARATPQPTLWPPFLGSQTARSMHMVGGRSLYGSALEPHQQSFDASQWTYINIHQAPYTPCVGSHPSRSINNVRRPISIELHTRRHKNPHTPYVVRRLLSCLRASGFCGQLWHAIAAAIHYQSASQDKSYLINIHPYPLPSIFDHIIK